MSADLHIHVFEGITEDDLAVFNSHVMGSKYFNMHRRPPDDDSYDKIANTPNTWIGEVSWLKAALFEDAERYVPGPVETISKLIGEELPVLTPELRDQILAALKVENSTSYRIAEEKTVAPFLEAYMGKKLFQVSW